MAPKRRPAIDRLRERIRVDDAGCWIFTGRSVNHRGYGRIYDGKRYVSTHRLAYTELVGLIPHGLEIDHLCRVRLCCNPAHLEPVTRRENQLRGETISAINAGKTHCIHGHEFTAANTYEYRGKRLCRACQDRRSAEYHARKSARRSCSVTPA